MYINTDMIYTFGCSHTYGVEGTQTDTVSWPEKLAELLPEHTIEDYSFPGTSLEYSIYQFNRLHSQRTSEDIFIFQITVPHRYTHWPQNYLTDNSLRYWKTPNYNKYHRQTGEQLYRYGPSTNPPLLDGGESGTLNPDPDMFKLRYLYHNDEQEYSNYFSMTNWLQSRTDVAFKWADYKDLIPVANPVSHKPIQSIQSNLNPTQYQLFCSDESNHFGESGSQWVAEWIHKQLINEGKL